MKLLSITTQNRLEGIFIYIYINQRQLTIEFNITRLFNLIFYLVFFSYTKKRWIKDFAISLRVLDLSKAKEVLKTLLDPLFEVLMIVFYNSCENFSLAINILSFAF